MSIYDILPIGTRLEGNTYPGRGIVIGKSEDGKKAVIAYESTRSLGFTWSSNDRGITNW